MASASKDDQPLFDLASRMEGPGALSLDDIKAIAASQKIDLDARNKHGWSPLMIACVKGDEDMVKFLLDQGADPNARCFISGNTPMHFASLSNHCGCLSEKSCSYYVHHKSSESHSRLAILGLLISRGAILLCNSHGLDPPFLAALHGVASIVKFFAKKTEGISGCQLSTAEKVKAFETLGAATGLLLDEHDSDKTDDAYLYLHKAVLLHEKSGISSSENDYKQSELAVHFSLFSTKECKTVDELEDIQWNCWAIRKQCFLVAERVVPQEIKNRFILPRLLVHGHDGMCNFGNVKEGSQVFREAMQWELQSKLRLGSVLTTILGSLRFKMMLDDLEPTEEVGVCFELLDLSLLVLKQVPKRRLLKVAMNLLRELGSCLLYVALNCCKSKELFEALLQFGERMVGILRRRCGTNTPSITQLILKELEDVFPDSSKNQKLRENRVKLMISRMVQCEDASETDNGGASMLHSLLDNTEVQDHMQFFKEIALILIRNGCDTKARDCIGQTAEEMILDDLNPDTPEIQELLSLISSPTSVLSLEELAARTILRHKIPHEGILPRHLSVMVRGEPDSDQWSLLYNAYESSSDSELYPYLDSSDMPDNGLSFFENLAGFSFSS